MQRGKRKAKALKMKNAGRRVSHNPKILSAVWLQRHAQIFNLVKPVLWV